MSVEIFEGIFYVGGAVLSWMNVRQLYLDRVLKGVHGFTPFFFTVFSLWSLLSNPLHSAWLVHYASITMLLGSLIWLALLLRNKLTPRSVVGQAIYD